MTFEGPEPRDYENVVSLNLASVSYTHLTLPTICFKC